MFRLILLATGASFFICVSLSGSCQRLLLSSSALTGSFFSTCRYCICLLQELFHASGFIFDLCFTVFHISRFLIRCCKHFILSNLHFQGSLLSFRKLLKLLLLLTCKLIQRICLILQSKSFIKKIFIFGRQFLPLCNLFISRLFICIICRWLIIQVCLSQFFQLQQLTAGLTAAAVTIPFLFSHS